MNKEERMAWFRVLKDLLYQCPSVVLAGFLEGAFQGFRPFVAIYMMGLLIDAAYAREPVNRLIFYSFVGAFVTLILSALEGVVVKKFNQNMEYMYEQQNGPLSAKSMKMDFEYLEDAKVHNMRESITGFVPRFGLLGMVMDSVYHASDVLFTLIGALIILLPRLIACSQESSMFVGSGWCSVLLLLTVLALTIGNMKVLNYYREKLQKMYDEVKSPIDARKRFYVDLYAKADSQKDIRMCEQNEIIMAELQSLRKQANIAKKALGRIDIRCSVLAEPLAAASTIIVYLFAAIYGFFGIISIGSVVSFAASIRRVSESLFTLSEVLGDIKYESAFAIKYVEFMELNQRKHEGTIPMEKRRDNKFSVEFDHVSFKYPGSDEYVIKDLNLKFVIGEKMAIVGKNGSGKTTFIKLLCRLYDVTEGSIKVNGIDIRKYDYKEYCDLFAVVFQDFCIFDFPLGENIACSNNVEESRAIDALKRAGLEKRLSELSEGLKTHVGKGFNDEGVNFSGGEKQKMAIARAVYKDAPFVIMDEPTAALDPEAETEVFIGFDRMVGRKTAIYISHRLASCKFCENILVFDKGKVVQQGTHEELEKQEGLYNKLWNAQAQYYT